MFYQNMPLYLQLIELLKIEYAYVHNLPKEYKYSLGSDVTIITWKLIDLFIEIQTISRKAEEKRLKIEELAVEFDKLKLRIRFLSEIKLISLHQVSHLNKLLVEIGKMIGSWQKHV